MRIDEHPAHRVFEPMQCVSSRRRVIVLGVITMMMLIVAMALLGCAHAARPCGRALPRIVLMIVTTSLITIVAVHVLRPTAATRPCARSGVFVGGAGLLLGHQGLLSSAIEVAYTFPRW
jgi:hypothetical protein